MNTYTIQITKTVFETCIVDAENIDDAKLKIINNDYTQSNTSETEPEFTVLKSKKIK